MNAHGLSPEDWGSQYGKGDVTPPSLPHGS